MVYGGGGSGGRSSRLRSGMRDMLLSLLPLVVIALLLTGITRACSFSPGGPSIDPNSVPSVDVAAGFRQAAQQMPFPVRQPDLPASWRATTIDVRSGGGTSSAPGPAVRVSWLTPTGHYLRLVESNLGEDVLVSAESGVSPTAHGTVAAGGASWTVYSGVRDEPLWLTEVTGVRLLETGDAQPAEFDSLAAAVLAARPLVS